MPTIINCTKCKTTVDMSTNFTILFADWSFTPKHDPGQLVGQFRPDLRLVLEKSIICNLWNVSLLSQKESNNKEQCSVKIKKTVQHKDIKMEKWRG